MGVKFDEVLSWLERASATQVNSTPLMTSYEYDKENEQITFSYSEDGDDYFYVFNREDIEEGEFDNDGTLVCVDDEGDRCLIRAYTTTQLKP